MQNEAAELERKTVDVLIQSNDIEDSLVELIENQTAYVIVVPLDENVTVLSDAETTLKSYVTSNTMLFCEWNYEMIPVLRYSPSVYIRTIQ